MKTYPPNLNFVEFIRLFRDRYAYKGADGPTLLAVTNAEALSLSKYLFTGIIASTPPAVNGADGASDLGECLERCAMQNIAKTELMVHATEEELQALGMFLVRGLVGVFLTLERVWGGAKYARQ